MIRTTKCTRAATSFVLLVALVAITTACGSPSERQQEAGAASLASLDQGSEAVVVVLDGDPPTLNPNFHGSAIATTVTSNIFDALFFRNARGEIEPGLATEWENPAPGTWVIAIREDVSFHNGDTLTAEDVVFSIERVLDEDLESPQRGTYSFISSVQALDTYTVEVKTAGPYPPFLVRLSDLFIVPADHVREVGAEEFAERPVGTGPYLLASWKRDRELVTEAFGGYWRGNPEVQTVVWRVIPEDTTQVQELRAGGVDLVPGLLPDQVPQLESERGIVVKTTPITRTMMLPIDRETKPLNDVRVRQALNYAIDKETIIEHLLNGMGTPLRGILPPMVFGYNPDVEPYPYDPELARSLLAEAGYPEGFTIELNATASKIPNAKQVAEAIRGYWQDVDVETEFNFYPEIGPWLKLWPDEVKPLAFCSWGGGFDADFYYYPLVRDGNIYAVYTDPALDSLVDEARVTADTRRREALYQEAEAKLVDDAGWVFLWSQQAAFGLSERLDWEPRVDESIWAYDFTIRQ